MASAASKAVLRSVDRSSTSTSRLSLSTRATKSLSTAPRAGARPTRTRARRAATASRPSGAPRWAVDSRRMRRTRICRPSSPQARPRIRRRSLFPPDRGCPAFPRRAPLRSSRGLIRSGSAHRLRSSYSMPTSSTSTSSIRTPRRVTPWPAFAPGSSRITAYGPCANSSGRIISLTETMWDRSSSPIPIAVFSSPRGGAIIWRESRSTPSSESAVERPVARQPARGGLSVGFKCRMHAGRNAGAWKTFVTPPRIA
jgi:hypothetical protein